MDDVIIKRFDTPNEVREFAKDKFETIKLGHMTIGRASYEPGWIWSVDVGPGVGKKTCDVAHVGMVVSGRNIVTMDDGREIELKQGDFFAIGPGHDSRVVGDEPYVSLHFLGADAYAR